MSAHAAPLPKPEAARLRVLLDRKQGADSHEGAAQHLGYLNHLWTSFLQPSNLLQTQNSNQVKHVTDELTVA